MGLSFKCTVSSKNPCLQQVNHITRWAPNNNESTIVQNPQCITSVLHALKLTTALLGTSVLTTAQLPQGTVVNSNYYITLYNCIFIVTPCPYDLVKNTCSCQTS